MQTSPDTENKLASAEVAIICMYILPIHKITQQFDYRLPVALPMLHAEHQNLTVNATVELQPHH